MLFYAHIHIFCDYLDTRSKDRLITAFKKAKNAILGDNKRDTLLHEVHEDIHPRVKERLLKELDELKYRVVSRVD